ncbi:unnamed protein product [Phytomonas sp. EM1]|nr:unnamed protein product [Phytomonas sp. EM1]|eukprot:CCW65397.1 unnamed protein product [Phytomonas sp. isolate EM1]
MPRPIMRLAKELKEAQTNPDPDIHLELYDPHKQPTPTPAHALSPSDYGDDGPTLPPLSSGSHDNLFTWLAVLQGPPDTPFEGGSYRLLLRVPRDYPMIPPTAHFLTRVFHPNVSFADGAVCLDILKTRWSPAWTLNSVCRAILNLMAEPDSDSPFNCDAGNLMRANDKEGYTSMVRMYAIMDAGAPPFKDEI